MPRRFELVGQEGLADKHGTPSNSDSSVGGMATVEPGRTSFINATVKLSRCRQVDGFTSAESPDERIEFPVQHFFLLGRGNVGFRNFDGGRGPFLGVGKCRLEREQGNTERENRKQAPCTRRVPRFRCVCVLSVSCGLKTQELI